MAMQARHAWGSAAFVLATTSLLGLATLPRQYRLLWSTSDASSLFEGYQETIRAGIWRLILADRIVPDPTLVVAALVVGYMVTTLLGVAKEDRPTVWAIVWLGVAPALVGRIGELALTYLAPVGPIAPPGDVMLLPHRFVTGPLFFWRSATPAPAWLEVLDARVNLVTLWAVVIWAVGLHVLDGGGRRKAWQVILPVGAVLLAGAATWILGPPAAALVLRLA